MSYGNGDGAGVHSITKMQAQMKLELSGVIVNSATAFKTKHGVSCRYYGGPARIVGVHIAQGTPDTTAEGTMDVLAAGVSMLSAGPVALPAAVDAEVSPAVKANFVVSNGQIIEMATVPGGTGDAADYEIVLELQPI